MTYSAINIPAGASFNSLIRVFDWTPGVGTAGTYNVTFSVSDGSLTDSEVVTITVGSGNQAPVLTPIGSQAVNEGVNLNFTISGTDPDGDALTYSATGLPVGATFDALTQTLTGRPRSPVPAHITLPLT